MKIRKTYEELQKIQEKHNVNELWSFSRYNTYKTSPYEYFLKYIKKVKEDREDCIYAPLGTYIHDILEQYYTGQITYEDMPESFEDALTTLIIADLKFDRTNKEKDQSIRAKYTENIRHFFKHHQSIKHKVLTEQYVLLKVGKHVFNGYIDMCYKDDNGVYTIIDFKSSTIYKGEKAIKEGAQLILYSEALRQMGVPLEKIRCGWDFVKYCNVEVTQANGQKTVRQIERCKIGESLHSNAKMWLKKLGYDPNQYLETLLMTNDISCLPEDVQEKYKFDDCYVFLPLSEELIENLKTDIIETIEEINAKKTMYEQTQDDKVFWDSEDNVKQQSYYFAVLSGYSANLHKPYAAYLDKLKQEEENKKNIFANVGTDTQETTQEDDLSWLNDL